MISIKRWIGERARILWRVGLQRGESPYHYVHYLTTSLCISIFKFYIIMHTIWQRRNVSKLHSWCHREICCINTSSVFKKTFYYINKAVVSALVFLISCLCWLNNSSIPEEMWWRGRNLERPCAMLLHQSDFRRIASISISSLKN